MTGRRFGPDFSSFNARVADHGEPALYVFDWELSGWGTPAPDLEWLDPTTYDEADRGCWPDLDQITVERAALAGVVLRQVAGIAWCTTALAFEDTPWATLADLPVHAATLRRAGRRGGWL